MPLDRDVIFVSEVGEEAATGPGIEYLVNEHWREIEAEICLAETGGVRRRNGNRSTRPVETTEKQPQPVRCWSQRTLRPRIASLRTNAVVHLARAVEKIAACGSLPCASTTRREATSRNWPS